ncbi:unnamed protein product [Adineta ricciae]|uniref:Uncharacterized protein n=1 Tax=Adineta ricciae TaxID=249248 RepID=A0A815LA06_ADIRI|nr:unnamed protein product [Adineta ricciae]CAF1405120.1 unnamed protein product [Adineta ricciae]
MNKQIKHSKQENIDDEQIEKTLNFFDSILDPYLKDEEATEKKLNQQLVPLTNSAAQQFKLNSNGKPANKAHPISAPSSSPQRPTYFHVRNNHPRQEQYALAIPAPHVRRYTSENNLNQLSPPLKPKKLPQKTLLPEPIRITAVSTDDLSTIPSWKNFSRHTRLSALTDKTNATSASLIDLTSIDKVSASRPRYRFIPPTATDLVLREELEVEQHHQPSRSKTKSDPFFLKLNPSNQPKHAHKIIKPAVIIPSKPKSAPVTRLTETNIRHQTDHSAFKPLRPNKNGSSAKVHPTPANHAKRTEGNKKSNVNVGLTNSSNHLSNSELLYQHRHNIPQFHQSMLNLSSAGVPDTRSSNLYRSRVLYQPPSANFYRSPQHVAKSSKSSNRQHQYPTSLPPPPPAHFDDSSNRRTQPAKNSSHINGLAHPSHYSPHINGYGGGGGGGGVNRSQQQVYPYHPYPPPNSGKFVISITFKSVVSDITAILQFLTGLSSPRTPYNYLRQRQQQQQQPYLNPVKVQKHHTPRHPASVQSAFLASLSSSENGFYPVSSSNIYHFNQTTSSEDEQSTYDPRRRNFHYTTYL